MLGLSAQPTLAGYKGLAVSLVSSDEFKQLQDIEKVINRRLERVEASVGWAVKPSVQSCALPKN